MIYRIISLGTEYSTWTVQCGVTIANATSRPGSLLGGCPIGTAPSSSLFTRGKIGHGRHSYQNCAELLMSILIVEKAHKNILLPRLSLIANVHGGRKFRVLIGYGIADSQNITIDTQSKN